MVPTDSSDQSKQDRLGVLGLLPVTLGDERANGVPHLLQVRHTREYAGRLAARPPHS
jgi:hypothetical protein